MCVVVARERCLIFECFQGQNAVSKKTKEQYSYITKEFLGERHSYVRTQWCVSVQKIFQSSKRREQQKQHKIRGVMMKPLKIFVLLSSSVVLFENLGGAFGEVSAASTTGRRGALRFSAGDASSFDVLDKEDASSHPEEEKKMNSWIDFCSSSARELYESPIDPILESEVQNRRQDPPIKITDRGQMWSRAESNLRADARTKSAIFEKRSKSIPLMLFGDSITEYWKLRVNREVLMKTLRVENERDVFVNGISGDETSHALYRLTHGAFPRATVDDVVVMIGTNNLGRAYRLGVEYSNRMKKADEECLNEEQVRAIREEIPNAVAGILAVIEKIRVMSPNSRIVVLGILPRGLRNVRAWTGTPQASIHDMETSQRLPDADALESRAFKGQFTLPNVFTKAIDFVNDAVKRGIENEKVGGDMVYYRECADAFLTVVDEESDTKMLNYDLMKDALHPDKPRGYEALGKCVRDILDSLPENWEFQNVRARESGEIAQMGVAT